MEWISVQSMDSPRWMPNLLIWITDNATWRRPGWISELVGRWWQWPAPSKIWTSRRTLGIRNMLSRFWEEALGALEVILSFTVSPIIIHSNVWKTIPGRLLICWFWRSCIVVTSTARCRRFEKEEFLHVLPQAHQMSQLSENSRARADDNLLQRRKT